MQPTRAIRVLFVTPYPYGIAPNQRFRFEQYLTSMKASGMVYRIEPLLTMSGYSLLYRRGSEIKKAGSMLFSLVRRLRLLVIASKYDYIFIVREATLIGPPIFEWIIAKILRKKIIYDFDDAIWTTDNKYENKLGKILRWRSKVSSICKWSYKVSVGNAYLGDFARKFNNHVVINPTTIDTRRLHNVMLHQAHDQQKKSIVIGWTGTHSTLKYLEELESVLRKILSENNNVYLLVIANKPSQMKLPKMEFRKWNKETEIEDLLTMDIGIMPIPDDEWSRGKCGFKALQYMSLGIPCAASPVGVNNTIINNGVNGFLCGTDEEWLKSLESLIKDKSLRKKIGELGKQTVEKYYSVQSNEANFLSLFS